MLKGQDIYITQGGTLIAGTKSNDMQVDGEMIEVASVTNGQWRHLRAGRKQWSVGTTFLVGNATQLSVLLNVGSRYQLSFTNGTSSVTGYAYLRTCKISAAFGNLVTGSFQFEGDGPLT